MLLRGSHRGTVAESLATFDLLTRATFSWTRGNQLDFPPQEHTNSPIPADIEEREGGITSVHHLFISSPNFLQEIPRDKALYMRRPHESTPAWEDFASSKPFGERQEVQILGTPGKMRQQDCLPVTTEAASTPRAVNLEFERFLTALPLLESPNPTRIYGIKFAPSPKVSGETVVRLLEVSRSFLKFTVSTVLVSLVPDPPLIRDV